MKQQAIQVAHLLNGGGVAVVRRLSERAERRAIRRAVVRVSLAFLVAVAVIVVGLRSAGRAVYAPGFLAVWAAVLAAIAAVSARRARRRMSRFAVGTSLECDAFSPIAFDLVRRDRGGFVLTLVPGMRGRIDAGRSPLPIEAMVTSTSGPRSLSFDGQASAEIYWGSSTFAVRSTVSPDTTADGEQPATCARVVPHRMAAAGLAVAAVASVILSVPRANALADRPYRAIAAHASTTPWEAEKLLRVQAQLQARSLHQCFDPLPVSCQRPGFVGVGLSLAKDGEIRSHWIARSTYGQDCPVDHCMREVISTWDFEPLPVAMRVVLPVQVLRTAKPLPAVRPVEATTVETGARDPMALDWVAVHDGR